MTAIRSVPFFNYKALFVEHEAEYMATLRDCLMRGAFIMQRDLLDFETEFAKYLGVKHALGFADGTNALIVALKLARIGAGDEVIVPSHTFVATASAVHQTGATPVLCDCGPDKLIDVASARRVVTKKTKAIMPVQLNGRVADMDAIQSMADEFGLKIVEDSCQAFGAKYRGRFGGTFGVAGSFSFYPSKTLGAFGDAGAITMDDDDHAQEAREYRDHGRNAATGKVHRFGHNTRLDNIQAAILLLKLKRYDAAIARRRAIARLYQLRLGSMRQLLLPPGPDSDNLRFDIFQNYEIEAERRDDLRVHLAAKGVGTILQWGGFMLHQFEDLGLRFDAPYAEAMSKRYMMLPMNDLLSEDDAHYVCDAIESFYRQ